MQDPIIFICSGNTCRSPMAETLLKAWFERQGQDGEVFSRGLAAFPGDCASRGALLAMKEIGLDLESHRSQRVSIGELIAAETIVTMTEGHKQQILDFIPEVTEKVFSAKELSGKDIKDPFGGSEELYLECLKSIADCLEKLWPGVTSLLSPPE